MRNFFVTGIILFSACLLFVGCSSTLQVAQVNPQTGLLPTGSYVGPDEIKVKEPIDVTTQLKLLFVKISEDQKAIGDFIKNSIANLNCFESVKDKSGLQGVIIEKGLSSKYSGKDVNDLLILNELTNDLGKFLVLDWTLTFLGGFEYKFEMKVIDPTNMKLMFHLDRQVTNWAGLDEPLFYPSFNALKIWINQNKRMAESGSTQNK